MTEMMPLTHNNTVRNGDVKTTSPHQIPSGIAGIFLNVILHEEKGGRQKVSSRLFRNNFFKTTQVSQICLHITPKNLKLLE